MGLYSPDSAVFRSRGTCRMVAARRDRGMVSAARQTDADTAQCGFPIAWSIIYLCMGISGGLVLTSEAPARKSAVRLWFLQLGCNFLWSILFFVCRSPLLGMADIVVLDVLVILYLVRSANVRAAAAWLFVPYLCWILSPPTSTPIFSLRTGRGCKPGKGAMCSRTKI